MYFLVFAGLGLVVGLSCRVHVLVAVNTAVVLGILVAVAAGTTTWWALAGIAIMQFGYIVGGLLRTLDSRLAAARAAGRAAGR